MYRCWPGGSVLSEASNVTCRYFSQGLLEAEQLLHSLLMADKEHFVSVWWITSPDAVPTKWFADSWCCSCSHMNWLLQIYKQQCYSCTVVARTACTFEGSCCGGDDVMIETSYTFIWWKQLVLVWLLVEAGRRILSVRLRGHLCRVISVCLALMCTAHASIPACAVEGPMTTFW